MNRQSDSPYIVDESGKQYKRGNADLEDFGKKVTPKVPKPVEIFNVAHKSGYQNKYWCAAHEIVGTAFLLLAVQWGTVSGYTP